MRAFRQIVSGYAIAFLLSPLIGATQDSAPAKSAATEAVAIDTGRIAGVYADADRKIRVFKGIPFAAPPVGELRWKPPQPVKPWDGVRACDKFGPACPQPKSLMGTDPGSQNEDCLYLNVWTPASNADAKLPVMVWIHGGGCTTGAGSLSIYEGTNFARQGVVLVTINYRLGPLGFFAHPLLSKESPRGVSGNYGFLDQIEALQWVKRNIAAFGGDPDCVTIFGESAGSASVARLMVSPLARGLFHRAIAESGGAEGRNRHLREPWSRQEPMGKVGERIADALGCSQAPDPLAALRAKTPRELIDVSNPAQGLFGKGTHFGWIIDGWALPDDPAYLFESGQQAAVPFMAGFNANEGTVFLRNAPVQGATGYQLMVRTLFGKQAPEALELFPIENNDVLKAVDHFTTLSAFGQPARAMARAMEKVGAPAYCYYFTHVAPTGAASKLGAFHAAELPYVFQTLPRVLMLRAVDRNLSKTMQSYWVNFAKTGDPNGEGLPPWPAHTKASDAYQELGDTVQTRTGLFQKQFDLLEQAAGQRIERRKEARGEGEQGAVSILP
ncbi:MAG: carboxylesterase family protein [Candidatus Sumerlaeota bacterium]|nr:carboxylesterase family protein [Candidatus Sumerlaeota bacterium]